MKERCPVYGPSDEQCRLDRFHAGLHKSFDDTEWPSALNPLPLGDGAALRTEVFFLAVDGDGGPTGKVLIGREAIRRELAAQFFFDPDHLSDTHREEEATRWAKFCDPDEWSGFEGTPFEWSQKGEDYTLVVYRLTEPLPALADPPSAVGAVPQELKE